MKNRWVIIVASGIAVCAAITGFTRGAMAQVQDTSRQLQQVEPVTRWPGKAKRWALVIGVDKYSDPQISPLRGADNDARTLTDALVRYAGFPQDQVIMLATDQPAERQPTRINILRRLSNLASVVPQDGLLLISFAGHGIERGGQAYLIPSDSQISDDINLLEESAVSVTRMKDRIRATGVGQVVILLDACRNDPGGRADAPNPLTNAYVNAFSFDVRNREVTAFATIYATAVGQRAYEYTEKKQGYFTWAIVEGLKGAAANDRGEVTLASLISYVQESVPKHVAIDLGGTRQQRPFSQMEGYKADELVIAVSNKVVANTGTSTGITVDPTAFELTFWETIKTSTNADDFKSYLDKYPEGQFAALAKNKLETLSRSSSLRDSTADSQTEVTFWQSIKDSNHAEDYRAYLNRYPNGVFSDLAKARLAPLEGAAKEKEKSSPPSVEAKPMTFEVKNGVTRLAPHGTLFISSSTVEFKADDQPDKNRVFRCSEIRAIDHYKSSLIGYHSEIHLKVGNETHKFCAKTKEEGPAIEQAIVTACGLR